MADAVPFSHRPSRFRGLPTGAPQRGEISIGFVPMIDGAPLIAAQELGLFAQRGLRVKLIKALGWATIREKLQLGELHAAHAPGSLAYVLAAGLGVAPRACLTGFVMSANGSAVTLSRELWDKGARDAASLRAVIAREPQRAFRFGAPLEFSSQNFDLRRWLKAGGVQPDRDAQIAYVPSPIMHRQLESGHLDGYCVGEPWGSLAVHSGAGWLAATSAEISPAQIEKVLLATRDFAETQTDEHLALIAALMEASAFCEARENRAELARLLAQPAYLDLPSDIIARSLCGPLSTGHGERATDDFILYHRQQTNVPDRPRARRLYDDVCAQAAGREARALRVEMIPSLFREDLYRAAEQLLQPDTPVVASDVLPQRAPAPFQDSPLRMAVTG